MNENLFKILVVFVHTIRCQMVFFSRPKPKTQDEAPEGFCPNCWGTQEYDNTIRELHRDKQIDVNNKVAHHALIQKFRSAHPAFSVNDLKAHFRGHKYVTETLKLLPQIPEPIFIQYIFTRIAQLGSINTS